MYMYTPIYACKRYLHVRDSQSNLQLTLLRPITSACNMIRPGRLLLMSIMRLANVYLPLNFASRLQRAASERSPFSYMENTPSLFALWNLHVCIRTIFQIESCDENSRKKKERKIEVYRERSSRLIAIACTKIKVEHERNNRTERFTSCVLTNWRTPRAKWRASIVKTGPFSRLFPRPGRGCRPVFPPLSSRFPSLTFAFTFSARIPRWLRSPEGVSVFQITRQPLFLFVNEQFLVSS